MFNSFGAKMRPETALKRREANLRKAVIATQSGNVSYRKAALCNRVCKSTVWGRAQKARNKKPKERRTALKAIEEDVIVQLLLRCSHKGVPLGRRHLVEAAVTFIETLPSERQESLRFKDGRPGAKWIRAFYSRHEDKLVDAIPFLQEAKRFAAANADTLTTHCAELQALFDEYKFDADRVWNLDETGVTPGRDAKDTARERRFMDRDGDKEVIVPEFAYQNRITIMPVVSASGILGPSLWVFKGAQMPCRQVVVNGKVATETLSTFLPPNSLVTMEPKSPGVNSSNFYEWAKVFTESIRHLVQDGRKVLLVYDGYRSHMHLRVIEHLHAYGVVVYALPAHTSGKTQPCDTGIFRNFKREVNVAVSNIGQLTGPSPMDVYNLCSILRYSYVRAMTAPNIMSAFEEAGIWPVNRQKLLGVPRPRAADDTRTILSVNELERMYQEKCKTARQRILGKELVEKRRGFVTTTVGRVLTTQAAIDAAREQTAAWHAKELEAKKKADRKAERKRQKEARKVQNGNGVRRVRGPSVSNIAHTERPPSNQGGSAAEVAAEQRGAADTLLAMSAKY